jgi:hypothetical protein
MTQKQESSERAANALEQLRKLCPPGATVYTTIKHVSRSGMQREIAAFVIEDGEPRWLNGYIEGLGIAKRGKRDGSIVNGCGMDMGFHLVYSLSRTLYHDSHPFVCVGEKCPSNDHTNGDRDYTPHRHSDGGYALRQRWL